ncbi:MAG: adenylate/guanylate cyclase domain-containing protein [Methyloligellaceae bacterium]
MSILLRGNAYQKLRLFCGLVLFTFVSTHFINHAFGLWSVELLDFTQSYRVAVTRWPPIAALLAFCLLTHVLLALGKLAKRATLRMPFWEGFQLVMGLSIPIFIFPHIADQRILSLVLDNPTRYSTALKVLWGEKSILQTLGLIVVWTHACIGLHFWLRLSHWYQKSFLLMFALALIIPILGLAGFMVGGRQALDNAQQEKVESSGYETSGSGTLGNESTGYDDYGTSQSSVGKSGSGDNYGYDSGYGTPASGGDYGDDYGDGYGSPAKPKVDLQYWRIVTIVVFYSLLLLSLVYFFWRQILRRYRNPVKVSYVAGPDVVHPQGPTLLEISRIHRVPHTSVCGGRARCSTCRVRVISGNEQFLPPSAAEARTLKSIGAPPDVRLACQIRPRDPLSVVRIVNPSEVNPVSTVTEGDAKGIEQNLAVMFLDVRGFTQMSADKLPYDVVFILNRFFESAGVAITRENGWIDKYLGDGLMAVFGRTDGPEAGCAQALRAAHDIDIALDEVNASIESEIADPLRIGIGLHFGPLVVGELGYRNTASLTVIGRTVNAAARLEALTKEKNCQCIVSAALLYQVSLPLAEQERQTVTVRGLEEPLEVALVERARDLPRDIGN